MKALVLIIALTAITSPATAHAFLEKASPAAGANLRTSPLRVELHFTEALEATFSNVTVRDMVGRDMASGALFVTGTEMALPLLALHPGRYRVTWHAVSVDTHRTQGKYNFLVLP